MQCDRFLECTRRLELSRGVVVGQAERRSAPQHRLPRHHRRGPSLRNLRQGGQHRLGGIALAGANLLNDLGFTGPLGLTTKYSLPAKRHSVERTQRSPSHDARADHGRSAPLSLSGRTDQRQRVPLRRGRPAARSPPAPWITTAQDVENFSGIDDFAQLPNGNLLVTYMGAKDLTTPGGLVELRRNGSVVQEYAAARGAARIATGRASTVSPTPACSPILTASTSGRTSTSSSRPTTRARSASRPRRSWTP